MKAFLPITLLLAALPVLAQDIGEHLAPPR